MTTDATPSPQEPQSQPAAAHAPQPQEPQPQEPQWTQAPQPPSGDNPAPAGQGAWPSPGAPVGMSDTGRDAVQPYQFMPTMPPPPPVPVRGSGWRARVIAAVASAIVIAALGFPLGWLWGSVAPKLPTEVNGGDLYYADPMGSQSAGAESWYALISIGAGLVIGILAWLLLRRVRGPLMLVALALGGGAAGWIMWRFGRTFGTNRNDAIRMARTLPDGTKINLAPDIRIQRSGLWHHWLPYLGGNLVYLAIAAVAVYAVIAGFTAFPNLLSAKDQPKSPDAPGVSGPSDPAANVPSDAPANWPSGPPATPDASSEWRNPHPPTGPTGAGA